jgi:formylglycine-generating enzyme required for sulfatase activity
MDWYNSNAYTSYKGGNLTTPSSGTVRVLRGGSWSSDSIHCAYRSDCGPAYRVRDFGFRCAGTV